MIENTTSDSTPANVANMASALISLNSMKKTDNPKNKTPDDLKSIDEKTVLPPVVVEYEGINSESK
jgi:hypothetical protein